MSEFQFNCPECNSLIQAEEEWRGQKSQCPVCGKEIIIQPKIELKTIDEVQGESKGINCTIGLFVFGCILLLALGFFVSRNVNPPLQNIQEKKEIIEQKQKSVNSLFVQPAFFNDPEIIGQDGKRNKEVKTISSVKLGLQMSFYAVIYPASNLCEVIFWNNKGKIQEFGIKTNYGRIYKIPVNNQTIKQEDGITKYQLVAKYTPEEYLLYFVKQYPVSISFKIEGFGGGQYAEIELPEHHIHNFHVLTRLFKDDQRISIKTELYSNQNQEVIPFIDSFSMFRMDEKLEKECLKFVENNGFNKKYGKYGDPSYSLNASSALLSLIRRTEEEKWIYFKIGNEFISVLNFRTGKYEADGVPPGSYAVYAQGTYGDLKLTWFFPVVKKHGEKLNVVLRNDDCCRVKKR